MKKKNSGTQWFVYIVECSDATLYAGIARDVEKRIAQHNSSSTCKYTRSRKPVFLRYRERLADHSAALRREAEIKKFSRKDKLVLFS